MPTRFDTGDSPIYQPVAVRSALAAGAVVALLYCVRFTRTLPSAVAEAVYFVGFLAVLGLGWAGINGSLGSLVRREEHPFRAFSRLAFYVTTAWLYLHFARIPPFDAAGGVYFAGFLVLLGLWWAGMIGAVGSLVSREAHPLRALSLLGFYVAAALLVTLWGLMAHSHQDASHQGARPIPVTVK